ncbi:MAG TPA: hypothetical protein VFL42_04955, partial [Terriglobales bacterium]|nr:hypothetical protein [Terriglobales bacterium]
MDRTFWSLILRTLAVRLPQFALPWLMTTFAFAAVSSAVLGTDTKEHLHSIADSYTSARERVRPILTVGLITFLLAVAGYAAVAMCAQTIAFSQLVPRAYRGFALMTILYVGLAIWLGLLSRAGLSIPYLMQHEGAGAWNSVKASVSRSEGYEPFFVLLIVQTVFCSVWGPWPGRQVLFWFWRKSLIGPKTVEWLGYSLDALVPAAVETFLFVGFTVLYMELKRTANEETQQDFSSEAVRAAPI